MHISLGNIHILFSTVAVDSIVRGSLLLINYIYVYVTPILNNAHIFKNERTLLIIRKNVHLRVSFLKKRPQIIRNITHFQKWQAKVEKT